MEQRESTSREGNVLDFYFPTIRLNDADIINAHHTQFQWEDCQNRATLHGIEKLEMNIKRSFSDARVFEISYKYVFS